MMRFGTDLIRRAANYLNYRFVSHAIILMYHRVANLEMDSQLLAISPQHFDEQLEILHRYAHPISLQELTSMLQKEEIPHRGVVITFDDGYADNLHYAKPLLEHHDIPATIFIAAGWVGSQSEFWWDQLERLLLLPGKLPARLYLEINGNNRDWNTYEATEYVEEDYQHFKNWNIEQSLDPSPRHRLYRSLYHLLHSLNETERQKVMQELDAWAKQDSRYRRSYRTLTADEVSLLAEGGLIEIGAHTLTHSALASLPISMQRTEIFQSKVCLEEMIDHPVTCFSYPHGSYANETISLVKETGFASACSSDTATISNNANTLCLPRFSMRDWSGEEFYKWLKGLIYI